MYLMWCVPARIDAPAILLHYKLFILSVPANPQHHIHLIVTVAPVMSPYQVTFTQL